MRLFNLKRIAYVEDLDSDPQVQQSMAKDVANRFKYNLEDSLGWNMNALSQEVSAGIFSDANEVDDIICNEPVRWGYVRSDPKEYRLDMRGKTDTLSNELSIQRRAIWDSQTKTMVFVGRFIVSEFDKNPEFKINFLNSLARAIDSNPKDGFGAKMDLKP